VLGELSLGGDLRPVPGLLPMVAAPARLAAGMTSSVCRKPRPRVRRHDHAPHRRAPGRGRTMGSRPGTGASRRPAIARQHGPAAVASPAPSRHDPSPIARSGRHLLFEGRPGQVHGDAPWWVLVAAVSMAPRTRSRASCNAVSANPTIVKPGSPGATSTSTRTMRPSRPWRVAKARREHAAKLRRLAQLRLIRAFTDRAPDPCRLQTVPFPRRGMRRIRPPRAGQT